MIASAIATLRAQQRSGARREVEGDAVPSSWTRAPAASSAPSPRPARPSPRLRGRTARSARPPRCPPPPAPPTAPAVGARGAHAGRVFTRVSRCRKLCDVRARRGTLPHASLQQDHLLASQPAPSTTECPHASAAHASHVLPQSTKKAWPVKFRPLPVPRAPRAPRTRPSPAAIAPRAPPTHLLRLHGRHPRRPRGALTSRPAMRLLGLHRWLPPSAPKPPTPLRRQRHRQQHTQRIAAQGAKFRGGGRRGAAAPRPAKLRRGARGSDSDTPPGVHARAAQPRAPLARGPGVGKRGCGCDPAVRVRPPPAGTRRRASRFASRVGFSSVTTRRLVCTFAKALF